MRFIAFLAAAWLLAVPQGALSDGEHRLTPADARMLASAALLRNDLALAAQVSDALIEGNPEDAEALLIRAAVALEAGRHDVSLHAAEQAWNATDRPSVRHHAALLAGQAQQAKGHYFRAELWLRKSLQVAPDAAADAEARRAYRAMQRRNPWRVGLAFGVAPSSNINNGTAAETVELFGLDFQISEAAQAHSGLETFAQAQLSRRLSFGRRYRTDLTFSSQLRRYWLSKKSREDAPDLSTARLSYEDISIGLSHQHLLIKDIRASGYIESIHSGRAGEKYSEQLGFGTKFSLPLRRDTALMAQSEVSQAWLTSSDDATIIGVSAALGLRRTLAKSVIWGDVGVDRVRSDWNSLSYRSSSVSAGLDLRESFLTAQLGASVGLERRHYSSPWHSGAERDDNIVSAKVSAVFPELEQYGFSPWFELTAQRRNSTIGFYDQNVVGMRLSIQSTF